MTGNSRQLALIRKKGHAFTPLPGLFLVFGALAGHATPSDAAPRCDGVLVRQFGPTHVHVGDVLTYKIQVANEGECDVTGATLTDYLPRKTTYREGQPAPTQRVGGSTDPEQPLPVESLRWNDVRLPRKGGTASFEVKVEVLPPGNRTLTDTACLEDPQFVRICSMLDVWVGD